MSVATHAVLSGGGSVITAQRPHLGLALSRSWGSKAARRTIKAGASVAVMAIVAASAPGVRAALHSGPEGSVIVRTLPGSEAAAERTVTRVGGSVGVRLPIIDGFAASVPLGAVEALTATPGVVSVTPDASIHTQGSSYDPSGDVNSMASITSSTGAAAWWRAGYTGAGVDVAVIDSGVSPVEGLRGPDKVVDGPDLSLESQAPNLTHLDTFGHGTFMAGLIAGRDDGLSQPYDQAPASAYRGMAPDARIVSLKVATADGGTDVSQIIAAIDWVVQHRNDDGLHIRVLNLSYGTNPIQSYTVDPLAYAAEVAWRKGIIVVAAAGNKAYQAYGSTALADPAFDPFLIAVGATDSGATEAVDDDTVADFSAGVPSGIGRKPDVVAPGSHVQGLRVPNSYLDATHPEGQIDDRYFRGSGTSEATAIVSGAAALIAQKYPKITPDLAKSLLRSTAFRLPGVGIGWQGSGTLRMGDALTARPSPLVQMFPGSTGTGSLELARGTDHLTMNDVVLQGEQDIFGHAFDSAQMAALEEAGSSWSGGTWNGSPWTGESWIGTSWAGVSWPESSWSGNSWSGNSWSGNSWSGNSWSGNSWSGNSWSGNSWSGNSWSTAFWG
jgi:serine protease AprX